jgi:hypothetical protein
MLDLDARYQAILDLDGLIRCSMPTMSGADFKIHTPTWSSSTIDMDKFAAI